MIWEVVPRVVMQCVPQGVYRFGYIMMHRIGLWYTPVEDKRVYKGARTHVPVLITSVDAALFVSSLRSEFIFEAFGVRGSSCVCWTTFCKH